MQEKPRVAIVGTDMTRVMALSIAMDRVFETTIVHSLDPWRDAARLERNAPMAMVLQLPDAVSVVEAHALVDSLPRTKFVFLADSTPLRPSLARIVREGAHAALPASESAASIESTIIALLAQAETIRDSV
jgi:hypothetical protein